MNIENKLIDTINHDSFDNSSIIKINNSIINTLDFETKEFNNPVIIENCIIHNLLLHACWFKEGLIFKNNHVNNYINYQMGGHNLKRIECEGNIFKEFVNFFDCQFHEVIEIRNNIFLKGSNLLGNKGEGFENTFQNGYIINGNYGSLEIDGCGDEQ